jgi:hypothetical protein
MTVMVTNKAHSDSRATNITKHEDGAVIDVRDGHLFVMDGQGTGPNHFVAIYAPGVWVSAAIGK